MKRTLALFLCFLFLSGFNVFGEEPKVAAKAAVLMDMDSGRVLWGKNENEPLSVASTTKIMTAIIALERCNPEKIVRVSKKAAIAPPVKMHLREGEEIRLYDLLLAMMLQSYNDAAVAVAEAVCGSTEEFCRAMNLKAGELGCTDTCFETPNGLDKGNHHSTAADMALITRYALENDDFVRLVNTPSASFKTSAASYSFINKNRLLREYEGALGGKTGFTNKAGQCFAGAAKRGDEAYVSVVLASGWGSVGKEQKWIDTRRILDFGFESFDLKEVISEGRQGGSVKVERGSRDSVEVCCRDYARVILGKNEKLEYKAELPGSIKAPVKKGQRIGTMRAYSGDKCIAESALVCCENVDKKGFRAYFEGIMENFIFNCSGNVV